MISEVFLDKAIGPLVGAVTGGLIAILAGSYTNYFNYKLNKNSDRLKSLNMALYHLLRIHRYAEFSLQGKPEMVFELLINEVQALLGVSTADFEEVRRSNEHLKPLIRDRFQKELEDLDSEKLRDEFLKAIHELSKVEPELAHVIAIRSSWKNSINHTDEYKENVLSSLKVDEHSLMAVRNFARDRGNKQNEEILIDIRKDLLSVARCVSKSKYNKIKKHIEHVKNIATVEEQARLSFEEIRPEFESFMKAYLSKNQQDKVIEE